MSLDTATHHARAYRVSTPVYEGPLDLLLQLIERAELDITKLALAQVTDQFLAYLSNLENRTASEVSGFLVIAARLVQIKSEALLPRPPQREAGEEDPGEALAQQLLVYKRYKEIAAWLGERDQAGLHTFVRLAAPPKPANVHFDMEGITLADLLKAAERAFAVPTAKTPLKNVVAQPKVTIREKIRQIVATIREGGHARFFYLIGRVRTRLEIVVSFLAVLELIKLKRVTAHQAAMFQDFDISPANAWDDSENFELEFGE
ncbi:MAG TPA: segregation/condensation protein A [Anaerolineales bacterium]|nr:segregation/condensation protein A [Anaerolineales bacterium]